MAIAESGGPTTQAGISYQNSIAALRIGQMLNPISDSKSKKIVEVRVEAPEYVDDIIVTYSDSSVYYIQAKEAIERKNSETSSWGKVWKDFESQYHQDEFKFEKDKLYLITDTLTSHLEDVKDITVRANSSKNENEWMESLGQKHTTMITHLALFLSSGLKEDDKELWKFFSSIVIERISRTDINDRLYYIMPKSNLKVELLFNALVGKVSLEAKHRQYYSKKKLTSWLEENNITLVDSTSIEEFRNSIHACNSILRSQKNTFAKVNQHIPRNTSKEITEWLLNSDSYGSIGILLDQAGSGKTVVMKEVLMELEYQKKDVLAIKADQQLTNAKSFDDIKDQLLLPENLEKIASAFSLENGLIVIIDQLDALSLSMAHDQLALDLILNLIVRLNAIPKVRLIISLRKFDYESDVRFGNLQNTKLFKLEKISDEDIEKILTNVGFNHSILSLESKELLKIPLHLNLFLMAQNLKENQVLLEQSHFSSLQDLYQIVWNSIIMKRRIPIPTEQERLEILLSMTKEMNSHQKIIVRKDTITKFDNNLINALDWLLSEGIVLEENENLSFFHQTFFDYCYARNFLAEKKSLDQVLLSSPQGLFQRPQMIHVLSYLRNMSDDSSYADQLRLLLCSKDLRYHLKDHLYHWVASLHTLKEFEGILIHNLFADENVQMKFLKLSSTNARWFEYWKDRGILTEYLLNEDIQKQSLALNYLLNMMSLKPEEVTDFLEPLYCKYPSLKDSIKQIVLRNENWNNSKSRRFLEAILLKMKIEEFQKQNVFFFWEGLAKFDSEMVCRIILHFMEKATNEFKEEKIKHEQKNNQEDTMSWIYAPSLKKNLNQIEVYQINTVIPIIINQSPHYFIETFVPWFIEVAEITGSPSFNPNKEFSRDELFRNWYDNTLVEFDYVIQKALIDALIKLSKKDPSFFREIMTSLGTYSYESLQFLIAHVYKQVPEEYSLDIIEFLVEDPRRLLIGHECYESRKLIEAVIPFVRQTELYKLQKSIINQFPFDFLKISKYEWEEISENDRMFFRSYMYYYDKNQFVILKSFEKSDLIEDAKKRLMELERKYDKLKIKDDPRRIEEVINVSPIASSSAKKMTDSEWIGAINKYKRPSKSTDWRIGGVGALAIVLQESIEREPERFINLFQKIVYRLDSSCSIAFLNGLANSNIPDESLFKVIQLFKNREENIIKKTIARIIEKNASQNVPEQIVELLEGYLYADISEDHQYIDDPLDGYYNSVNGAAMQALMRIFNDNENRRWNILCSVSSSSNIHLLAGCIYELKYINLLAKETTLDLFENIVKNNYELYFIKETISFFKFVTDKLDERRLAHLEILLKNTDSEMQEKIAMLITLFIMTPDFCINKEVERKLEKLFKILLVGSTSQRKGIVRTISANIIEYGSCITINAFYQLMNDSEVEVIQQFSSFLVKIESKKSEFPLFIQEAILKLIQSSAIKYAGYRLENILHQYSLNEPKWTLYIINIWLERFSTINQNGYLNLNIDQLIRTVINIYFYPFSNPEMKEKAMDTFDKIIDLFSINAQKFLSEWDRR